MFLAESGDDPDVHRIRSQSEIQQVPLGGFPVLFSSAGMAIKHCTVLNRAYCARLGMTGN